jgi:uncharacterized cupin superfamily protein
VNGLGPINVLSVAAEHDPSEPPFDRTKAKPLGPVIGAEALGATVYELGPGDRVAPYHYELGNEEWLLVLAGHPTVRHPDGETALEPWDVVCFPEGPDGAHAIANRTGEPARVMVISTVQAPAIAVQVDSDKIGIWPPGKLFRQGDAVEFWEGE